MIEKTNANMVQGLISKMMSVLEATMSKLSRYDEGSLIGSILSFTVNKNKYIKNNLLVKNIFILECVWFRERHGTRLCKFH